MEARALLLGVDGGGTKCRARLCAPSGQTLAEAITGPANVRLALAQSFVAIIDAAKQCLQQASLPSRDLSRIVTCLALAGASEPSALAAARRFRHPFHKVLITTDAPAARIGAHRERDGAVIVVGTGTVGWAELNRRSYRVGGWGLPISDEGSGAWLGCEALRRVLWAHDGRVPWTELLRAIFDSHQSDPHAIVRWTAQATSRDFGALAPSIVAYAERSDQAAVELMRLAGGHIDRLADRLLTFGAQHIALVGGLASNIERWLAQETQRHLVPPAGGALEGALQLARTAARSAAA